MGLLYLNTYLQRKQMNGLVVFTLCEVFTHGEIRNLRDRIRLAFLDDEETEQSVYNQDEIDAARRLHDELGVFLGGS